MGLRRSEHDLNRGSPVTQPCPTLCGPMDYTARQAPPSMGLSRQGYWSGLPLLSPGDLLNPGMEPESPALVGGFFTVQVKVAQSCLTLLQSHGLYSLWNSSEY